MYIDFMRLEARTMESLKKSIECIQTIFWEATENRDYGISEILRTYAGVNPKFKIKGRIMHGWDWSSTKNYSYYTNNLFPTFVWSKTNSDWAVNQGWKNFYDIGAPWIYLLDLFSKNGWQSVNFQKILNSELWIFGSHSNLEKDAKALEIEEFIAAAKKIKSKFVTVLLFKSDYEYYKKYIATNQDEIKIVTLGERRDNYFGTSHLCQLFFLMKETETVVIDAPSTALLYAISLKCKIKWFQNSSYMAALAHLRNKKDNELLEIMENGNTNLGFLDNFAANNLGIHSKVTPEEMRTLFGWNSYRTYGFHAATHILRSLLLVPYRLVKNRIKN